jgi:Mrp family chromosome partitioning ATPase
MCQALSKTVDPDEASLILRMKAIKHKVLVVSGKGGVGKSSTAAELAIALSEKGQKVAILDVDICGPSIPRLLNVEGRQVVDTPYGWIPVRPDGHDLGVMSVGFMLSSNETPVVWRGPRKTNMIKRFLKDTYWGKLDYLIIDTPPGTSDEHLSVVSALKKAQPDGAVVVTTPQEVSLSTIRKELSFCKKMNLPVLGIVENMSGFVCPCCGENTDIFMSGGGEKLAREYGVEFLGRVPIDPNVTACLDAGQCVFCKHKDSPAVQSVLKIVDNIIQICSKEE